MIDRIVTCLWWLLRFSVRRSLRWELPSLIPYLSIKPGGSARRRWILARWVEETAKIKESEWEIREIVLTVKTLGTLKPVE